MSYKNRAKYLKTVYLVSKELKNYYFLVRGNILLVNLRKDIFFSAKYHNIQSIKENQGMKVSARNAIKGTVQKVVPGAVNTEITLEIAPGVEMTAIITKISAEELKISEGKMAYAVIKSSDVLLAVD